MTGFSDAAKWLASVFDVTGSPAVPPTPFKPMVPVILASPVGPSLGVTPDATTKAFEDLLTLREGRKNVVYLDTKKNLTVGIGHLVVPGDCLELGDRISDAAVHLLFMKDSQDAMGHAVALAAQAGITDKAFLPYLASVCYQVGDDWTRVFPHTWQMICRGHYEDAARALDGTKWEHQTPVRVEDFQGALRRLSVKPATS